jgi:hypothetical protein
MPAAYKVRAMLAGLARIGEPSSFAGVNCGHVAVEHDADLAPGIGDTADDNHVVRQSIASMAATPAFVDHLLRLAPGTTPGTYDPRAKTTDLLVHPDGNFRLDRLLQDNGVVRRFIVVRA